jgi:multiple antibiotic resistance protein
MFFPFDFFVTLLIVMGPIKVFLVYAQLTRDLEPHVRRQIAIKAVVIAGVVGLVFIVAGKFLLDLFHFSTGALTIAGGAILFVFALNMVLSSGGDHDSKDVEDPTSIAVFPLAMPLIAQPIGIVVLTVASARFNDDWATLGIMAVMLLIVMVINIVVLLGESRILKYINPQAINVAERILGILLCALAVQAMLNGANELGIITLKAAGH